MVEWHFVERNPYYHPTTRNPVHEDFSDESVDRPAQALVREAIQNSLDARQEHESVCVRFYLSGRRHALSAERAMYWFGNAWPHYEARGNGLRGIPRRDEPCPFIVVEDFGTMGLKGDPAKTSLPDPDENNHFFGFFRAEGLSTKESQKGGRWGVGKFIFMRSSRINTLVGLTERAGDHRRLLMGWTVLKHHTHQGKEFIPDGRLGTENKEDGVVLPIEDEHTTQRFVRDFALHRDSGVPGLSVVVPYCDPAIDSNDVRDEVVREYFYPILTGALSVRLNDGDGESITLDENSLPEFAENQARRIDPGLKSTIELAMWAKDFGRSAIIELGCYGRGNPPSWGDGLVSTDIRDDLSARFRRGERIALRIPIWVQESGEQPRKSYFDLYIQHDRENRGYPPVYIRNGIIIPRVRNRRVRGHRILALVVIDHKELGSLLGDAETPAHTHWSKDTDKFRDKYVYGEQCINFVKDAPAKIAEILSQADEGVDRFILAEFFPRPPIDEGFPEPETTSKQGEQPEPTPDPPDPKRKPIRISQIDGGFVVTPGDTSKPAREFQIRMAYDRTRGHPLKKYDRADFTIDDLEIDTKGVSEVDRGDNTLRLRVDNGDFRVQVTGFDANRDLYVKADPVEVSDDSAA